MIADEDDEPPSHVEAVGAVGALVVFVMLFQFFKSDGREPVFPEALTLCLTHGLTPRRRGS